MSVVRLMKKAFVLATRARRRFIMFTVVYAALIGWVAYSVDAAYANGFSFSSTEFVMMLVSILLGILISMFYANIIVTYRKIDIATFKCIGWKNNHVRVLIIGEIFSVTLIAFLLVVEFIFHWIAIGTYITSIESTSVPDISSLLPVQFLPIILTFIIMLGVQIFGILIANTKVLKVRPIQALQMKN